ncbi:DUF2971 domain-containing protein [Ruminococcus sp. HUN007]|uniref:DUF2971 domain-containing protein n=1 Tax=Ruminococcus sp. HUN007 TaxID=1514668 RepID=UPI0018CC331D|nr:DUF2971 domain-containing protein [Ruminococcus sp. HUN007]
MFGLLLDNRCKRNFNKETIDFLLKPVLNYNYQGGFLCNYEAEKYDDAISLMNEIYLSKNDGNDIHPLMYIKKYFSYDYFTKFQNSSLHNWGVASLTKNCVDDLMWTHYADSHTGICLAFELDCKEGSIVDYNNYFEPESLSYFHSNATLGNYIRFDKVKYTDEITKKNVFSLMECFTYGAANDIFSYYGGIDKYCDRESRIKNINEVLFEAGCTKKRKWNYEEEYRMVMFGLHDRYGKKASLKYRKTLLKGIIFGCKVDKSIKKEVIDRINDLYKDLSSKPIFYQAKYLNSTDEMIIIKA